MKIVKLLVTSVMIFGMAVSSAMAIQAAPQAADKAKEMMEKNKDKGNSAAAHANAEAKKAAGQAQAEVSKNKPKPNKPPK